MLYFFFLDVVVFNFKIFTERRARPVFPGKLFVQYLHILYTKVMISNSEGNDTFVANKCSPIFANELNKSAILFTSLKFQKLQR